MDFEQKIGVVGCGTMGAGIAQTCAERGFNTVVHEINQEYLDNGLAKINKSWMSQENRGKITPQQVVENQSRLRGVVDLAELADRDLVIEAIFENEEAKLKLFPVLDEVLAADKIIASNSSSLSISRLALSTKRPEKVTGMHFFNPAPVMKLVEAARTPYVSQETIDTVKDLAASLGKTPVEVKDTRGFAVNRLLVPYLVKAVQILEEGVASKEDIDTAMKLGCGYPMGPLELIDLIGLDITLDAYNPIREAYPDQYQKAPETLIGLVAEGKLGRKTKEGFYRYE